MIFCTRCGQELRPGATYCDACGARVAADTPPEQRDRRTLLAAGAGTALALIVGFGLLLLDGAIVGGDDAPANGVVRPTPTPTQPVRPPTSTAAPQAVVVPAGTAPTTAPTTPSPPPEATATPEPPTPAPLAAATATSPTHPTETALPPTATSAPPTLAPPTATSASAFQGRLLLWSTLGEPVGFVVDGATVTADPAPIAAHVTSGAFEQQVRSLGLQLDAACDYAFIAFEGGGTYDPATGWIEGWFLLSLALVSDGTGECGYEYVPARVSFDGTIAADGVGAGAMYNEGLAGSYGWTSVRNNS